MFQILDSIATTCLRYADDYLLWAGAIILAFIVGGAALRLLKR